MLEEAKKPAKKKTGLQLAFPGSDGGRARSPPRTPRNAEEEKAAGQDRLAKAGRPGWRCPRRVPLRPFRMDRLWKILLAAVVVAIIWFSWQKSQEESGAGPARPGAGRMFQPQRLQEPRSPPDNVRAGFFRALAQLQQNVSAEPPPGLLHRSAHDASWYLDEALAPLEVADAERTLIKAAMINGYNDARTAGAYDQSVGREAMAAGREPTMTRAPSPANCCASAGGSRPSSFRRCSTIRPTSSSCPRWPGACSRNGSTREARRRHASFSGRASFRGQAGSWSRGTSATRRKTTSIAPGRDFYPSVASAPTPRGGRSPSIVDSVLNKHVLFVCTGNVCRSPMAEGLLRQLLGKRSDYKVDLRRAGRATGPARQHPHAAPCSRMSDRPLRFRSQRAESAAGARGHSHLRHDQRPSRRDRGCVSGGRGQDVSCD